MKRVSGKIYLSNHFFGLQIFDTYGKDTLGKDRSGQFRSGHVRTENFLPKSFGSELFGIQNILGDKKFFDPKFLNYFGIKLFLDLNFFFNFSWHQNLVQLKSRVWHSQPSLFSILSNSLSTLSFNSCLFFLSCRRLSFTFIFSSSDIFALDVLFFSLSWDLLLLEGIMLSGRLINE